MIELGLHTDNWRPLSLGQDAAIAKIDATGIKHIEFCAFHVSADNIRNRVEWMRTLVKSLERK